MKSDVKDYHPIDYTSWILGDEAREGVNIKKLGILTPDEIRLFEAAIPYQDQRNDPGQGEIVTLFSIKLLEHLPGMREAAVPAAMLHDIGWYGCDPEAWIKLVKSGGETEGEAKRRPHQNRGGLFAGRLMERTSYPDEEYHAEIADIIGDHDTRKLPTTLSGEIVRAADLLWRVTLPCLEIYFSEKTLGDAYERIQKESIYMQSPHNLGELEQQIGRIELVNTIYFKFKEKSIDILQKKYTEELEKIVEFYFTKAL